MQLKMTDANVKSFTTGDRIDLVDTLERGLTLRVTPAGMKTWAVRGRSKDGVAQRVTLGTYPEMKLSIARSEAADTKRQLRETVGHLSQRKKTDDSGLDVAPTLEQILNEYEALMAPKRRIWQRTKTGRPCEAYHRIESVFGTHLQTRVTELSLGDLASSMMSYAPESGKKTANGQVSKARAYLMPVLDWCVGRNRFDKEGRARANRLDVVDLRSTHDPASEDHSIRGKRERALDHAELGKILPLLVWPAPACLELGLHPEQDTRPLALRFLLLTCARREELVRMRWRDFREESGTWHKPYVKTHSCPPRQQSLPLSDAAIVLLRSLPNYPERRADDLVFPNSEGGFLGNWHQFTRPIQRESGAGNWHRHDLRRTGATIMKILKVAPRTIDEILAHNAGHDDNGTSRALENYLITGNLLEHVEDPQKEALDRLADALALIEGKATLDTHDTARLHSKVTDSS